MTDNERSVIWVVIETWGVGDWGAENDNIGAASTLKGARRIADEACRSKYGKPARRSAGPSTEVLERDGRGEIAHGDDDGISVAWSVRRFEVQP